MKNLFKVSLTLIAIGVAVKVVKGMKKIEESNSSIFNSIYNRLNQLEKNN